jgi:hypothetical protein
MIENRSFFQNKTILIVILFGILIRVLLSLITYHPDLRTFQYAGQVIAEGNILNFYDYLQQLPESEDIKRLITFNYPPAIYFFHGAFNFIFTLLFGSSLVNGYLIEIKDGLGKIDFMAHLFLLKLPYLIFDILAAVFFSKLFNTTKQKILAFSLWMFNPVAIYSSYILGQFDIIPTFFVILSLFLAKKKKLELASLSLGFGIAFKLFPIFLLIPLCLLEKKTFSRFKLFGIGLIPYLVSILPYLPSAGFRSTALLASQTDKSFYASIPVSGGLNILLFPLSLSLLYLFFYFRKKVVDYYPTLWRNFLISLIPFFIFTHIHPQWFLWLTPLLIIEFLENGKKHLVLSLGLFVYFMIYLFFYEDASLTIGAFSPIVPVLYNTPNIWQLLGINVDYIYIRSLMHSVFAASGIYFIYTHLNYSTNENY